MMNRVQEIFEQAVTVVIEDRRAFLDGACGGDAAPARCADILHVLSQQLAAQRAAGKRYLVGDALSAVDVYWAAVAATIDPLPDERCKSPMPPDFRAMYASSPPQVREAASQELVAHRDFVYREHVGLPLDFAPD